MEKAIIYLGILFVVPAITTESYEHANPEWVNPHSWETKDEKLLQIQCPKMEKCDVNETKMKNLEGAYRRLVYNIFDRNKFKTDDSSNVLYRTMHIHATDEQLLKLKNLNDPDEIDSLIAEILKQTNFGTAQLVKEATIDAASTLYNAIPSFDISFEIPSRTIEISINFALIVGGYIVCRKYGINFMIVITFSALYFLYLYLDYECRKKITVEDTITFIYGSEKDPCQNPGKDSWWQYLFGMDSKTKCREYLSKKSTNPKNQCGVVDLFNEFTSNIIFKQMKIFSMSIADMVQTINATYGFIITAITLFFMKDLVKPFLYALFKFILSPSVWISSAQPAQQSIPVQYTSHITAIGSGTDIRDVNLSKALDLMLIHKQQELQQHSALEPSQVQNLPIENTSAYASDTSGVSSNIAEDNNTKEANITSQSKSQVENNSNRNRQDASQPNQTELLVETEIFSLDDLPESQSSKSSSYSILSSSDFEAVTTIDDEELNTSNDNEEKKND